LIFDSGTNVQKKLSIPQTNITQIFKSKLSQSKYESLNLNEKYRILDLLYEPNGYTIIGFTKNAYKKLTNERLGRNFMKCNNVHNYQ